MNLFTDKEGRVRRWLAFLDGAKVADRCHGDTQEEALLALQDAIGRVAYDEAFEADIVIVADMYASTEG